MASLINSIYELQEIKEIQLKKKLDDDMKAAKYKLEQEFHLLRTDQRNMLA